jgi:hypothetical protein
MATKTIKCLRFRGAVTNIRFALKPLAIRLALEQTRRYQKAINVQGG